MMGVCFKDSPCALFGINCNDSALLECSNRSNEIENVAVRDRLYHGQKAMPMSITTSSLQTPAFITDLWVLLPNFHSPVK